MVILFMKHKFPLIFLIVSHFFFGCAQVIDKTDQLSSKNDLVQNKNIVIDTVYIDKEVQSKKVLTGIDVLERNGFDALKNKRIGLITNQTGVNSNLVSTIDVLNSSSDVKLVALYGPEHGVRGEVEGGQNINNYTDSVTKLPVYSLYGKTQKPTQEMLNDIDIIVYDIQDIGVRSYTYISTMGLAIEAAAENGIDFFILDRPNPLGGIKIEGNIIEDNFISFIGQFPIPYVYGLTCGELAKLLIGEGYIETNSNFNLTVIKMENWEREMVWDDTKLDWVPTSPHIPNSSTSYFYPMTGVLGELRSAISIGVGYTLPFQIVGAEWIDAKLLSNKLNSQNIDGLRFRPISFKPYYAFGKNNPLSGVQIFITDYKSVNLLNTQFHILFTLKEIYPSKDLFKLAKGSEIKMFNKAIGTNFIYETYKSGDFKSLLEFMEKDVESFKLISQKYYLY